MPNLDFRKCFALEIKSTPVRRLCSFHVDVTYNGNTFKAGRIIEIGELDIGNPEASFFVTIDISGEEDFWLNNRTPFQCEGYWLADLSEHQNTAFVKYLQVNGRLSQAQINGVELKFEIVNGLDDVDLGDIKYWTDEQQQRDYPGDMGLQYKQNIQDSRSASQWPN